METTSGNTAGLNRRASIWTGPDFLRHGLRISLWVRWFAVFAWVAQLHNHVGFGQFPYIANGLFAAALLALNGYLQYRMETRRHVSWRWALALSAMDVVALASGLASATGGEGNTYFVLYFVGLALFAAVCTSVRTSLLGATVVAALYVALSSTANRVGGFDLVENGPLLTNVIAMYAIVGAVSLVSRFEQIVSNLERSRRKRAVDREKELYRERVELSQGIHDTIAQSAFTLGLGLETAIDLAVADGDEHRNDLVSKLQAMLALSKSTMWELRHPIEAGPIFQGRELNRVLRSHSSTFSAITSIPAEFVQSGTEPLLQTDARRRLFSIAHNAMTNALRHAHAEKISLKLNFEEAHLQMIIMDDGIGLPNDFAARGHGFANMRKEMERMGGTFEVIPGESGRGIAITCTMPYDANLEEV